MSVSDGSAANAATFNGAFLSKLVDSTTVSKLTLNRVASGSQVTDVQATINDHETRVTQNETDIATNVTNIATNAADIATLESSLPFSNYAATSDPSISNDLSEGYAVGSRWVNVTLGSVWSAVDVSSGAAVWKRLDKARLAVSSFLSLDMSSSNVTDAAYVELSADTGADEIKRIQSFYPAGSIAYIAIGAAASEVNEFVLAPGGNGEVGIDVSIPANSRLSIKLLSGQTTVASGVLVMNLLTEV